MDKTDSDTGERAFGEVMSKADSPEQVSEQVEDTSTQVQAEPSKQDTKAEVSAETTSEGEKEPEVQYTEKGTKLDPNPLSAAHQQLANERKVRQQYEAVLSNPELLAQYMKQQFGIDISQPSTAGEVSEANVEEAEEINPDAIESVEDVAKLIKGLQKRVDEKAKILEEKTKTLEQGFTLINAYNQVQSNIARLQSEIQEIATMPEFDKNSPEYIEGLDKKVLERYQELDVDPQTGLPIGRHSLLQIAKDFIDAVNLGKKVGSTKAQTIIKDRSGGKVVTTPSADRGEEEDEEDLPPSTSIAKGIAKLGIR